MQMPLHILNFTVTDLIILSRKQRTVLPSANVFTLLCFLFLMLFLYETLPTGEVWRHNVYM
jgi:hypothetical protein